MSKSPINTPDSSTTYNHIMMSICTTHKLIPDHTQHTKTVNLKNQDTEPQQAMLNIFNQDTEPQQAMLNIFPGP